MALPASYTETTLSAYVLSAEVLGPTATDLGWTTLAHVQEAINSALVAYNPADTTIANATNLGKLRALAAYYAWRAAWRALSNRYDWAEDQQSYKESQKVAAAKAAMEDAQREAMAYGGDPAYMVHVDVLTYPSADPYAYAPDSARTVVS